MTTPRIPPLPPKGNQPDKTAPTDHKKIEKVEKIEKVSEIDDESRARKFRQCVEQQDQETSSDLPNPFSLFQSSSQKDAASTNEDPSFDPMGNTILPNQASSPPPSASALGTGVNEEEPQDPLPRSSDFWSQIDDPTNAPPEMRTLMQETPRSSSRSFFSKEEKETSHRKEGRGKHLSGEKAEFNPFGPPGKPYAAPKETKASAKKEGFSPPRETDLPLSRAKNPDRDAALDQSAMGNVSKKELDLTRDEKDKNYVGALPLEEKSSQAFRSMKKEEEQQPSFKSTPPKAGDPTANGSKTLSLPFSYEEKEEQKKSKKETGEQIQVASPTIDPLPPSVIPIAHGAAEAAAPFLSPEALSIYFHMVGTIVAIVSPRGDSRTEFILNSPTFANSKFYGSTISIERFSTAPYQLNIRLTGSNEAVNLFNQNIPNLLAAFEKGKFPYVVNRIDAVYRPLFRRKEEGGGKDSRESGKESQ
jgi:hypothetical protein